MCISADGYLAKQWQPLKKQDTLFPPEMELITSSPLMLASTLSCTLVSPTTKWQIFLTRYLFSPWKLSSHTKRMRNFIRCPSQFHISCAYPSLSRVLPKKKQCTLTFSSEPQQHNPRNGPSHCHQKPPVRSLRKDLCLLIHLWGTFSTKIQPIASKSWDAIQNRFSNFCALLSTKGSPQSWEKRKSQELIPQSAWDWLHVLSLNSAARSQHRTLLLPIPVQPMNTNPQLVAHFSMPLVPFRRNAGQKHPLAPHFS